MEHARLTEAIIGAAMKVHNTLGSGFLESVYQNSLAHELGRRGLFVELRKRVQVRYDGIVVGDFVADMLVEGSVLVEIKSTVSRNKETASTGWAGWAGFAGWRRATVPDSVRPWQLVVRC